jgi:hypothetical protein
MLRPHVRSPPHLSTSFPLQAAMKTANLDKNVQEHLSKVYAGAFMTQTLALRAYPWLRACDSNDAPRGRGILPDLCTTLSPHLLVQSWHWAWCLRLWACTRT